MAAAFGPCLLLVGLLGIISFLSHQLLCNSICCNDLPLQICKLNVLGLCQDIMSLLANGADERCSIVTHSSKIVEAVASFRMCFGL